MKRMAFQLSQAGIDLLLNVESIEMKKIFLKEESIGNKAT